MSFEVQMNLKCKSVPIVLATPRSWLYL